MAAPRFRVFIRDSDYQIVDELDAWQSLSLVLRFNDTGTWVMEVAATDGFGNPTSAAQLLTQAAGIVVRRDNETIFSGSAVTELRKTWRTLSLAGVDDNVLLEEPARPTPSQASGPYPNDYDVRTGQASTVMRAYVAVNIGPSAPVGCQLSRLTLAADPLLGGTVTGRANFQSLQALLASLAVTPTAGGLGFRIIQSDADPRFLEFRIWAPEDRTAFAKFGVKLSTAQDYEDVYAFPDVNYWVVMGGDGFGANRTIVEGGDAGLIAATGRRITGVHDARGITDPGELNQKLAELLAGAVASRQTTITPFEVPSLEFGTDWDFGDLVTVVVDGEELAEVVRDVEIELTTERGAIITPMIGDAGSGNDDVAARHLKAVKDRLTNIELNWRVPDASITRAMLTAPLQPPIGEIRWLAGPATPSGWLVAWGQLVSRTTYSALWVALGTTSSPWGQGDGSTTFNVPDLRGRSPIGAGIGSPYAAGDYVGATTATIAAHNHTGAPHTHPGSHSHGLGSHVHTGPLHTHPGSHSHGLNSHNHLTDINHDHPNQASAAAQSAEATNTINNGTLITTTVVNPANHTHPVNLAALGSSPTASGGPAPGSSESDSNVFAASAGNTGAAGGSTDADTNAPAASYSGNSGSAGSATPSIVHPSAALQPVIYAGT